MATFLCATAVFGASEEARTHIDDKDDKDRLTWTSSIGTLFLAATLVVARFTVVASLEHISKGLEDTQNMPSQVDCCLLSCC